MGAAKIEGDEIVIRVPVSAVAIGAPFAFDAHYGKHDIAVEDPEVFAREIVCQLNAEAENGDTAVVRMLDKACVAAAEAGALGLSMAGAE